MRAFLLISTLHFFTSAFANPDSIPVIKSPTLTGFGKQTGNIASKEIGSGGGTITSPDGRMELMVPPNALETKSDIRIITVTNVAPGGRGNSYKLEPSTISFQHPAKITFHYNENDFDGGMEELQSIAYQDDTGQWYRIQNVTVDTIAKTISGSVNHFSYWTNFLRTSIRPASDLCAVGAQLPLAIVVNNPPPPPSSAQDDDDDLAAPIDKLTYSWSVNGITGGSGVSGTVSPSSGEDVTFTAPGTIPRRNPVEVSVTAQNAQIKIDGKVYKKLKLVSNIKIYDHVHYTYIAEDLVGHLHMIDSSSCDIKLNADGVKVYNIVNNDAWSDWPEKLGRCRYTYPDRNNWKGMVEIAGVAMANYDVDHLVGTVHVHIKLAPAFGNSPTSHEKCPGGEYTIPSRNLPASPVYIGFSLGVQGSDILIDYGNREGFNEINAVKNGQGFIIRMKAY